ncbi:YczE/YyaS/YitT family protein [Lawsonibacter sp. LCP25S3_G6]|uniref:YczE/YyaS/YitT family protein n=1 Tax=unclassified Lawsonibacter TaxID=2617946 RepID=UPI003F9AFD10
MKTLNRWIIYIVGMLILALGLTLNTKSGLGVSPIISMSYAVSEIWHLNFGDMTFLLYTLFVIGELILHRGKYLINDLGQLPLSLIFSRVLNLYSALIPHQAAQEPLWKNLLVLLLAIVCTGIGAAFTVNMRLVPNPGDGIVAALGEKTGREQGVAKNIFDVCCVASTCTLGLIAAGHVVGIGLGTLVAMVGVGRVISLVNHISRERICRAAGLLEPAV